VKYKYHAPTNVFATETGTRKFVYKDFKKEKSYEIKKRNYADNYKYYT